MADFSAIIDQSACDKLLSSTGYPLVVVDKNEPFPGCASLAIATVGSGFYEYSDSEIDELFEDSVKHVLSGRDSVAGGFLSQIYSFGGSWIQQARQVLSAAQSSDYEGPEKSVLQKLVDEGVEKLARNLRSTLGDIKFYGWCPHLRITVKTRPTIKLQSPRIDLDGLKAEIRATGELWVRYPWLNCYRWCTKWEVVHKCDKIASLTVAPDISLDAHADFSTSGAQVFAEPRVDKLRLDYDILREIPLEGIANSVLGKKKLKIYDASKLIATVPVMESQFRVDSISLPANPHGVTVEVIVTQI